MIHVIIHLSKPIEFSTLRVKPNVNYNLWIMMCQCRLFSFNKCTTLVWDTDSGQCLHVHWACIGTLLPAQFYCEPKI